MKFNRVIIYKVPFDNTYKNVVDYHTYYKIDSTLVKGTITVANVEACRDKYFYSLPKSTVYNGTDKSVKVIGKSFEVAISRDWELLKDYNYIRFQYVVTEHSEETVTDVCFAFITRVSSNNDSNTKRSCTINCEIDYWTQYVTSFINTPVQNTVRYEHESAKVYNSLTDDRLPQDYIEKNSFEYLFDDAILFLVVDYDSTQITWDYNITSQKFDLAGTTFTRLYIPIAAFYMNNDSLILKAIVGTSYNDAVYTDCSVFLSHSGLTNFLNSQYTYGAFFTLVTPLGVLKKTSYTQEIDGKLYLKLDSVDPHNFAISYGGGELYIHGTHGKTAVGEIDSPPVMFDYTLREFLPIQNKVTTFEKSFTPSYNKNVNAQYSAENERKLLQYPYTKLILDYKSKQYNITPEPTDTEDLPVVQLDFSRYNSLILTVKHTNGIADVLTVALNDGDSLPIGSDTYQSYNEAQFTANASVAGATAIASVVAGIALAPVTGGASLIGGLAAGVATTWKLGAEVIKAKEAPDTINCSSSNSFDLFATTNPRIIKKTLKPKDLLTVTSVWNKYGVPIKAVKNYAMYRFWFDYKQYDNASFPQIYNDDARKTIENAFNNGLTIWHCNNINDTIRTFVIGDYSRNNPDNNDCTEVS